MNKEINITECCQKLLLMVKELHTRGFEKLRIYPGISPSGCYWRCEFKPKNSNNFFRDCGYSSGAKYNYFGWNDGEKLSVSDMADLFQQNFFEMLEKCKGKDKEYCKWYSNMLNIIGSKGLPYSYADWETPNDCWSNTSGDNIPLPPIRDDDTDIVKSILFGIAVGDALGVPIEFKSRESIRKNPVKNMTGYGTYNQPPGTWSDDSSLAFCLAEALTQDFDIGNVAKNFVKWAYEAYWTAHDEVFDIGISTRKAITNLANGESPLSAGCYDESSNGNGSLMRILPLLVYLKDKQIDERFFITKQISSITHGHIRSVIACFYYLEFAQQILQGKNKYIVYNNLQTEISDYLEKLSISSQEIAQFNRLLKNKIWNLSENEIRGSGYVIHTLEASIWCLLTTESFEDAVLEAVNLGEDTDTTGAVTGGLAGLLYGFDNIPKKWLQEIARYNDINELAERITDKIASR